MCRIHEWKLDESVDIDQLDELEAPGWLKSLFSGSDVEVGLFPLASYSGWVNVVYQAKVWLYSDTNTETLPGADLAGAQSLLDETPSHDPDIGANVNDLGVNLNEGFEQRGSIEDLTGAIELTQNAVKEIDDDHPFLSMCLRSLGSLLNIRHSRTGAVEDLTRAIEAIQKAVEVIPENHPAFIEVLESLVRSLTARYKQTGQMNDIASAVEPLHKLVRTVPSRSQKHLQYLKMLSASLRVRFKSTGSTIDLERAIEVIHRVIKATPEADYLGLAEYFNLLADCLDSRFEHSHSPEDLDTAIKSAERAIEVMSENHPDLANTYHGIGIRLDRKFDVIGSTDILERAVEVSRRAVEATADNDPNLAMYLGTLSRTLAWRYDQTGSVEDLTRGIEAIQEAVGATPDGHPSLPEYLNILAGSLLRRHERTGSTDDRTKALEAAEKAVVITPDGDKHISERLSSLGLHLFERYKRTRAMDDLEKAVQVSQQAVEKSLPTELCMSLNNHVYLIRQLYHRTGSMDDLDRATKLARKAVEVARNDSQLHQCLTNLGNAMVERYDRTESTDDLTKGIETARKAVKIIHKDDVHRASYHRSLGDKLGCLYEKTGAKTDQDDQLSTYVKGWECTSSSPAMRIVLADRAANINALRAEWDKAYHLMRKAVFLLPKVSPRSLKQSDMQENLILTAGVATCTAAMGVYAGKPASEVLSILELGRGVIAGLLIDTRGDLSDLTGVHPLLADEFDTLRKELDSQSQNSGSVAELNRRHHASRELDEIIERIRAQDGFHDFLQPPPTESLMAAAEAGPIVVINANRHRCDAILVERHTIRLLELPDLKSKDIKEYVGNINGFKHHPWPLLEWLWTNICRPCLDALGFTEPLGEDDKHWPHVWWVPTGPLSKFPLHAAGIYTPASKETVLDRVVSSYASSLKALQHGRRRQRGPMDEDKEQSDAILVAMEQTEGQMSLPNAKTETERVGALCPLLHLTATTPPRLKADILKSLDKCKVLHFAGHGESKTDPSQSCLLLDDWKTNPLTVGDLRESWLQRSPAFLAYLSACSTGNNQVDRLLDEAIHLVSAFQLAGFRHVVGTLWEVSDPHCVDVATVLYQTLCEEGMTDEAVSLGLHRAVRKLRDESFREGGKRDIVLVEEDEGQTPGSSVNTFWIPYIHFGA